MDWQPGDLALCIDGSPPKHPYFIARGIGSPIRAGAVLTVRAVAYSESRHLGPGLLFEGVCAGYYEKSGVEIVFALRRFRKICPHTPDAEDAETIRLLNGQPVREDA